MKKKQVMRTYNFSDAKLITLAGEKIAFIRRDVTNFDNYGVVNTMVDALELKVTSFSDFDTDVESLTNQTTATALKDAKADEVKIAIRSVMSRAELKYGVKNPKYKKFGADTISKQTDANLLVTGKRVVRVGNMLLSELSANGLTTTILDNLNTICNQFETAIIDKEIKVGERDIEQEDRVEAGNEIYNELVKYTNTGQAIWSSVDVAKYNDYVIYNTPTATPPTV